MTLATAYRSSFVKIVASVLLALGIMLSFTAPHAHAATTATTGLTEVQIQAILGMLTAFNVPAATIANVNAILHKATVKH